MWQYDEAIIVDYYQVAKLATSSECVGDEFSAIREPVHHAGSATMPSCEDQQAIHQATNTSDDSLIGFKVSPSP
jgi:hypothetical protein